MTKTPKQIVFEITSVCQLHCPCCYLGSGKMPRRNQPFMDTNLLARVVDESKRTLERIYIHNWGEPTLHPKLEKIIDSVTGRGFNVDFSTNGQIVDAKMAKLIAKCDTVAVSIDGMDQETYQKYRVGGNWVQAMRALADLAYEKPGKVVWIFCVFSWNEHQIESAQKRAEEMGVILALKPPYVQDSSQSWMLPKNPKYQRYTQQENGNLLLRRQVLENCDEFYRTMYVLSDGRAASCCYDHVPEYPMGDLNIYSTERIWNGRDYVEARRYRGIGQIHPMCKLLCKCP